MWCRGAWLASDDDGAGTPSAAPPSLLLHASSCAAALFATASFEWDDAWSFYFIACSHRTNFALDTPTLDAAGVSATERHLMRLWVLWLLLNRCVCCAAFGASLRVGLSVPGRRAGAAVLFSHFSLRHRLAVGCQAHACSSRALGAEGTMDSAAPLRVVGVFGCTGSGKSTVTQSSCALSMHARSPIARLSAHLNQKPETRNPKPARWPGLALLFLTAIELAHKAWRDMSACNERRSAKRWLLRSGLNVQKLFMGITSSLHPIAAHRYLWCANNQRVERGARERF